MADHNDLGKWGEELATQLLIGKGYTIAERNWRMKNFEVDIIAFRGDRIIFVEVKTRQDDYADPLDAIDRKRINHLVRAANTYVLSKKIPHEIQFDIITIIGLPFSAIPPKIEHIEDAFFAPLRTIR